MCTFKHVPPARLVAPFSNPVAYLSLCGKSLWDARPRRALDAEQPFIRTPIELIEEASTNSQSQGC
jgi:hypothetical protein